LGRLFKPRCGQPLNKSDKYVSKYHRPEDQHANVPAEVESKTGAKHEQHQAQERFPLFPPTDQQTDPKSHKYAGCDRTKDLAKVQNTAADHSGGNGGVHTELVVVAVRALEATPFRVVNSNQWL
jgi:hypothetical protein